MVVKGRKKVKTTCPRHEEFAVKLEKVAVKVDFLYDDAKERKERYKDIQKKKERRMYWILGTSFTFIGTIITWSESIRLYIKDWLMR